MIESCLDIGVVLVVGEQVEAAPLVDPEVGVLVRGAAVLVAARLLAPVAPTEDRLLGDQGPFGEGIMKYLSLVRGSWGVLLNYMLIS